MSTITATWKRMHKHLRLPLIVAGAVALLMLIFAFMHGSTLAGIRAAVFNRVEEAFAALMPPQHMTRQLEVPFRKQQHALSCEMASLRSALEGVGVKVTEAELLKALPRDPTPKKTISRGVFTWGDPNKGFVGNVDGRMPSTGYGVHADPVAELASQYAEATRLKSNDAEALTRAIDAGHPVIVWSVLGSRPSKITWKTPDGTTVNAAMYEHSLVVSGYKRNEDGTIASVVVVDPRTGIRQESWKDYTWRTSFLDHQAIEIAAED
jgi:uncharacterized protein YvpB